jgi:glycosyltransferase involved in cell wall biosynthesis
MIESMACGTPVIATRWGAVPEVIVEDGRGGLLVDNYREIAAKLEEADEMDPLECRAYAEERFSRERMVDDYMDAYRAAIERAR